MIMLEELNQYESLGTPEFFCELFNQIKNAKSSWTPAHVRGYFYNKIINGHSIFDGCMPLAEAIEAVKINNSGEISLNPFLISALVNEKYLANKLLEMVLIAARKDDIFHEIFCSKNISYDIIYRLIQIDNAAFRFRYANFRRLLIDFSFLYPHPDQNIKKYIINSKYKKLFDREILPEIKRRKLNVEELEKLLEKQKKYGEDAEKFILDYEKKRLKSHTKINNIQMISIYDVSAGYDIVSFNDLLSREIDRFIEVKSFSGVPNFHWSRNEIDVARIKKDKYFLYLVDREQMNNPEYEPITIQDPHDKILDGHDWTKSIDSYSIRKI